MTKVFCDGGARGNPGPAACAYLVYELPDSAGKTDAGNLRYKCGKYLGVATNNFAEYSAVIEALFWLRDNSVTTGLNFFLDSLLVVSQLNGKFQIKNETLKELYLRVRFLEKDLRAKNPDLKLTYSYVPRAQNSEADFLVNQTLDSSIN